MNGMSFAHPWVLTFLAVVPFVVAAWWFGVRRGQRRAGALSRQHTRVAPAMAVCFALAGVALIVAAAQPRWGTNEAFVPREGAEIVIVLDVSRSMAAEDVAPNRLAAAKAALTATLDRLGGERVALVIFAGDARVRFPLTTDFAAAEQVISSVETGAIIVDGGTSASQGLDVALTAFGDEPNGAGRLIVLISDGDDLGDDPAGAAMRVRDAGVGLLVAGAGTVEGGHIPVYDRTQGGMIDKLDANGEPLVSTLNEPFLRALAVAAGGQYLGSNLGAVAGAVDGRVAALARARFDEQAQQIPIERFQWFAAAALALVVAGTVVEHLPRPSRRQTYVLAGALVALIALSSCASEAYQLNEDGRAALAAGDYDRAVALFQEAQAEEPANTDVTLNLAAALHAAGRFDEANQAARRALLSGSASVRGRAQASIGHHRYALGDTTGALDAFRRALVENPGDDASRHDYEVLLRLLTAPPPEETPPATPTPAPGDPTEPGGTDSGTPGPDGEPPGEGTPGPEPGDPAPGEGTPMPGPNSPLEVEQQLAGLDAQIAELIERAGEQPSTAEALEILELLAERARVAGTRDALRGGGDPNDY